MNTIDTSQEQDIDTSNYYRKCFVMSVEFVFDHYKDYFDDNSITWMQQMLGLPNSLLCLLSRIWNRRKEWLKTSSFLRYIPSLIMAKDIVDIQVKIQDFIEKLQELGFIEILSIDSCTDADIMNALSDTLKLDEIKQLCKKLDIKIQSSRDSSLNHLFTTLTKQRSLIVGVSLIRRLPGLVIEIFKNSNPIQTNMLVSIIRLNPFISKLCRRIQSLSQVSFLLL